MIFVFIFLILLICAFNELFLKKKLNKKIFWGICIILVILAGFRFNTGYDYDAYLQMYDISTKLSNITETNFEIGFSFMMYVFKSIGLPFYVFTLFISFLSIFSKFYFFDKAFEKYKYTLSFVYFSVFYFTLELAQIRLGLCMGLCLISTIFLFKKKEILFYITILFAASIHITAFAFLPCYFIIHSKRRMTIMKYLCILSLVLSIVNLRDLLFFINDYFLKSEFIYIKIVDNFDQLSFINISLILKIAVILVSFLAFKERNINEKIIKNSQILYLYGIILYVGFHQIAILSIRTSSLFRLFEVPLLCETLSIIRDTGIFKHKKIFIGVILVLISIYYIYKFYSIFKDPNYFNYKSIFGNF